MGKRGMWSAGVVAVMMMVEMGASRAAYEADEPLLVVVEAQPGLGVDAADVRQRIASELGQRVVSPSDPAAPRASQVLIVALDERDIRISVRAGARAGVSRAIPDVAEPGARLRAVAWLAGNLARDQVGPLLPELAMAPAPEQAAARTPPPPGPATTEPPATEPPPADAAPLATTDAAISASAHGGGLDPRWLITASGGATVRDGCLHLGLPNPVTCGPTGGGGSFFFVDSSYQVEVQHHSPNEGMIFGGAIAAGPEGHLLGADGFIGVRRPRGHWYTEATLGLGIEVERLNVSTATVVSSSNMGVVSDTTISSQLQPVLYACATGSIGIPINSAFDFVVRLGVHLASSGLSTDFISAGAGLRLKLP